MRFNTTNNFIFGEEHCTNVTVRPLFSRMIAWLFNKSKCCTHFVETKKWQTLSQEHDAIIFHRMHTRKYFGSPILVQPLASRKFSFCKYTKTIKVHIPLALTWIVCCVYNATRSGFGHLLNTVYCHYFYHSRCIHCT